MAHHGRLGKTSLYDILGVCPTSSLQEIKTQFYRLSMLYHPDRPSEESTKWRHDKFVQISNAYSVLSNEKSRLKYDREHGFQSHQIRASMNRSIWNPHPGARHSSSEQDKYRQWERRNVRQFEPDELVRRWSRWAEVSETKDELFQANFASSKEQMDSSMDVRNRIFAAIFVLGIYMAAIWIDT